MVENHLIPDTPCPQSFLPPPRWVVARGSAPELSKAASRSAWIQLTAMLLAVRMGHDQVQVFPPSSVEWLTESHPVFCSSI